MLSDRRLVLVRHAKAEGFAPRDIDRVLADRGRRDAAALGGWLREQGIAPDVAYVSSATRTQETWQILAEAAGWSVDPRIEGGLYGADEEGVIDLVRDAPAEAATVLVVGHNPTIGMLAQLLDDGEGSLDAPELAVGFPTGAAAVFTLECAWEDLEPMCARLVDFHVGRS